MAEETMVGPNRRLYEAVCEVVRSLHQSHGPLYLAILVRFESRPLNEWTLLLGSRPLAQDRYVGMRDVSTTLASMLSADHA